MKEKISIDEFDGKKFKIRFVDEDDNRKAVVTHYLHNYHNGVKTHFEEEATEYLDQIVKYKNEEENINLVSDVALQQLLFEVEDVPFPTPKDYTFKFIDLFAGIGGFRLAMQNIGGKCVFTSEWDENAKKTYRANFGEVPFGDITKDCTKNHIPENFDILCGGFPCQAFSIAGKRGGFEDTRGTLFFDVAEIIKNRKPKAIFLENVKGLRNHNGGKTLATILNVLRNDLEYYVPEPQIINAKDFGVPQNRERIYIVGFRKDLGINSFTYPEALEEKVSFSKIKEKKVVPTKYYLSTQYLQTLVNHKERHKNKGNGFGYAIIADDEISNAIVVGGMGRERNLVIDKRIRDFTPTTHIKGEVNREGIRKMTPREWARLQGFPDNYIIPVADASAYKQFGNSVAVPAIQATAKQIIDLLKF
jgi:DNA (cytosine-5)-methyltransferase 1